jgi:hypothetical protein
VLVRAPDKAQLAYLQITLTVDGLTRFAIHSTCREFRSWCGARLYGIRRKPDISVRRAQATRKAHSPRIARGVYPKTVLDNL